MRRKGYGRQRRTLVLEQIQEVDEALYERLVELRTVNPQGYRKALIRAARGLDEARGTSLVAELPNWRKTKRKEQNVVGDALVGRAEGSHTVAEGRLADALVARAPSRTREAGPDLDPVLDGSVSDVKGRIESGGWDAHLEALLRAETDGKGRKGVLQAIGKRIREVG